MGCLAGRKAGTYVGSAYGASFLLARTENGASETPVEMVTWGLGAEWADSAGADVISSSLGYSTFNDPADNYTYADMDGHTTVVTRAAEIAASKGILVVTAVGNEGNSLWRKLVAPSDANGDSVIAVGAVDAAGAPAGFSSHGPSADGRVKPDLAARGVSVPVPDTNNDAGYSPRSGTSFSTPILAGLATCLLQARPGWPPRLVIDALRKTASRYANPDTLVGYGIPNGLAALRWTPDTATVPPLPPATFAIRLAGPNPFAPNGTPAIVQLDLGANFGAATPHARVFDAHGRMVRELAPEQGAVGRWIARWDGRGTGGLALGSGMYFITFEAVGRQASVRVVSLR
jgi:subtilisin family serine protease